MRTTVRIDDDLLIELKELAHRENISLTRLFNRTLRAGAAVTRNQKPGKRRYREKPVSMGSPRIDLDKALIFVDAIEDEEIVRKLSLRK